MDETKRKQANKILLYSALVLTIITVIAPILSLISETLKMSTKYAPGMILIWVMIWVTILRLSRNYQPPKAQNRLLTFLVIASSVAFTAFILYCFK